MNSQETYNLEITKTPNSRVFTQVANFIVNKLHGELIKQLDGIDQSYWDFKINESIVTLHSEHYLGISVYGKKSKVVESSLRRIKSELKLG